MAASRHRAQGRPVGVRRAHRRGVERSQDPGAPRRLRQQAARATDAGRPWEARLPIEIRAARFRLRKAASKSPADAGIPAVGQAVALTVDEVPSKKIPLRRDEELATASPPPLWGRDRVGGSPNLESRGSPDP